VNAAPLLNAVAEALSRSRLEAVLIGNAAAALQGAPVSTLDFDFMFRKTAANLRKLRRFADLLGAAVFRPYYPASEMFRVVNDERGLQVDFMSVIHGVRSFASLRSRAQPVNLGGFRLWVADLRDIIASKRAAGRKRDLAVLAILEATLHERQKEQGRKGAGA
jgi:predicted nucleotidyltransferase